MKIVPNCIQKRDNRTMENIELETNLFKATTFGIGASKPKIALLADPFLVKAGAEVSIGVESHDEIPFFFACPGVLGAAKIGIDDAVNGDFRKKLHAAMTQYNLDAKKMEVYMGPCLTFSHTHIERSLLEKLMDQGYRAACKRTSGVDFLDVPVLVLVQCRELGIPMENIHIGDHDTFENPELLYSALRGDKETNLTIATLK